MKLVIDIPEEVYKCVMDGTWCGSLYDELKNGVPVESERKTGHWIIHSDDLFPSESTQECSECHEHQPLNWRCSDNYCPNCGAKMEVDNAKQ